MELLVMCLVVAAFVQHAAKDWWAGVTGKSFPSQQYRMERLKGSGPQRNPAREYLAGMWALGWDTAAHRQAAWWSSRQAKWEAKRSGQPAGNAKAKPMRDYLALVWHSGVAQRWQNAWQSKLDKRQQKFDSSQLNDAEQQPEAAPASEPIDNDTTESPTDPEQSDPQQDTRDEPSNEATQDGNGVPNSERIDDPMTTTTANTNSAAIPAGDAVGLDNKINFVNGWDQILQGGTASFEGFQAELASSKYGPNTQAAATKAMEAMAAAKAAIGELSEVICGHAVNVRDIDAASGHEVGELADLRR